MNNETKTDKATARPFEIIRHSLDSELKPIVDIQGIYLNHRDASKLRDELNRLIPSDEHAALLAVSESVKCLNLFCVQCDMCEGSGKHKRDLTSACSTCGGTGRLCNTPNSSDAEDLLKAITTLNELQNKDTLRAGKDGAK